MVKSIKRTEKYYLRAGIIHFSSLKDYESVCASASPYRSEIGFCGFVLPRQFHSWNKIDHMEYILEYVQKKVNSHH